MCHVNGKCLREDASDFKYPHELREKDTRTPEEIRADLDKLIEFAKRVVKR